MWSEHPWCMHTTAGDHCAGHCGCGDKSTAFRRCTWYTDLSECNENLTGLWHLPMLPVWHDLAPRVGVYSLLRRMLHNNYRHCMMITIRYHLRPHPRADNCQPLQLSWCNQHASAGCSTIDPV